MHFNALTKRMYLSSKREPCMVVLCTIAVVVVKSCSIMLVSNVQFSIQVFGFIYRASYNDSQNVKNKNCIQHFERCARTLHSKWWYWRLPAKQIPHTLEVLENWFAVVVVPPFFKIAFAFSFASFLFALFSIALLCSVLLCFALRCFALAHHIWIVILPQSLVLIIS